MSKAKQIRAASRLKKINIDNLDEKLKTLSPRELKYFKIMRSQSGVLFMTAKPGVGKSAIARSIARKLGMRYMDIRLSMVDETDVGLFPNVSSANLEDEDGNIREIKVLEHVVPKWAQVANEAPTLIHFEELNRAPLSVRNAALQLLLERSIGTEFEFNENVFMMSSGNLGEEDGTDVEDFDNALINRLIHVNHDLPPKEWIEFFAKDNVHPDIVQYIETHGQRLYVPPNDNSTAYATPRSWTFLSDFILNNYGEVEEDKDGNITIKSWGSPQEYINDIEEVGMSYIGNDIRKFISFVEDKMQINITDIIKDFPKIKKDVENWKTSGRRDRYSEMLHELKKVDITELNKKEIHNCAGFLNTCSKDERVAYIVEVLDDPEIEIEHKNVAGLLSHFKTELREIQKINDQEDSK